MEKKQKSNFFEPFKEIPAALKTFPKGLIRLWKEPTPDSVSVEKRRKDIMPWLYFFATFAVIMLVLGLIIKAISSVTNVFWMIGALGVVYCAFLLFINKKAAQKFRDIECDNCKVRMPYGSHVTFEELGTSYVVQKSQKEAKQGYGCKVTGTERVKVKVTCICPECGTKNEFVQEFRTAVCEKFEIVPGARVAETLAQFERDIREEQKNRFDGSTGAYTRGNVDVALCVRDYFGDIIQVG